MRCNEACFGDCVMRRGTEWNLHPDTRHDDRPCLIDGLQHREEKGEADAACYTRPAALVSLLSPVH